MVVEGPRELPGPLGIFTLDCNAASVALPHVERSERQPLDVADRTLLPGSYDEVFHRSQSTCSFPGLPNHG